jgi:hypothetical protein
LLVICSLNEALAESLAAVPDWYMLVVLSVHGAQAVSLPEMPVANLLKYHYDYAWSVLSLPLSS